MGKCYDRNAVLAIHTVDSSVVNTDISNIGSAYVQNLTVAGRPIDSFAREHHVHPITDIVGSSSFMFGVFKDMVANDSEELKVCLSEITDGLCARFIVRFALQEQASRVRAILENGENVSPILKRLWMEQQLKAKTGTNV